MIAAPSELSPQAGSSVSPLRILHVTYSMDIGGTEQVIRQIILGSAGCGVEHSIACIDGKTGPIGASIADKVSAIVNFNRAPGFDLKLVAGLRKAVVDLHIDVVHCHQYTPYIYGLFAAVALPCKVIFTEHGRFHPDTWSWKRRLLNPFLQWRTNAITAISRATADALGHYEWFNRSGIDVIYNGLESTEPQAGVRDRLQLHNAAIVFGTICRFDPIKNLPLLIGAFEQLLQNHPSARLVLIGDGDQYDVLQQLVLDKGLVDKVLFTGFVDATADYMSALDVFVLSSYSEGTSMTLLQAMAMSRAVVVTRVGGNEELISDGVDGLCVPSDDPGEMVAAMEKLAGDANLRQQLGDRAKATFTEKFNLQIMIDQYLRLYRRIR